MALGYDVNAVWVVVAAYSGQYLRVFKRKYQAEKFAEPAENEYGECLVIRENI
jgi:hypothetical protein